MCVWVRKIGGCGASGSRVPSRGVFGNIPNTGSLGSVGYDERERMRKVLTECSNYEIISWILPGLKHIIKGRKRN